MNNQVDPRNVAALNGTMNVTGNRSILNEADIAKLVNQVNSMNLNGMEKSILCNDGDGFDKYVILLYRQLANFISSNWNYNEAFLKSMGEVSDGFDKYVLDNKLLQNGSLAIVKMVGNYYIVPYTMLERDIYDYPTKIRTLYSHDENNEWNKFEFTKENFVIIKNTPDEWNMLLKTLPSVQLMYRSICQVYENMYSAFSKFLQLTKDGLNMDVTQNIGLTMNDILTKTANTFIPYKMKEVDGDVITREAELNSASLVEMWKNSVITIQQQNLLMDLWNCYYNAFEELKSYLGISTNTNVNKAERQINAEILTQQDLPEAQRQAMFKSREFALNKANEKWGTNWGIELVEPKGNPENNELENEDDDNVTE